MQQWPRLRRQALVCIEHQHPVRCHGVNGRVASRTEVIAPGEVLDASDFYVNRIARDDRSLMNVPFKLRDASLDDAFLKGALARSMVQLKGHRSVGGMRASIYNAMPVEGVRALVGYMKEFEAQHA